MIDEWMVKARALSKDSQAKLACLIAIKTIAGSKADESFKADGFLRALDYYEAYTHQRVLVNLVNNGADAMDLLPREHHEVMAAYFLMLHLIAKDLPVRHLSEQLQNIIRSAREAKDA